VLLRWVNRWVNRYVGLTVGLTGNLVVTLLPGWRVGATTYGRGAFFSPAQVGVGDFFWVRRKAFHAQRPCGDTAPITQF
jgi:hypothetical protein